MAHFFAHRVPAPVLRRKLSRRDDDPLQAPAPHQLVQLQQAIGNSGVRALLARNAEPVVQHQPAVQRFWGDEENEDGTDNSEDGGGSWVSDLYDSASELVTDGANAVEGATDAVSDWVSGGSETGYSGESESESGGGESGGWMDGGAGPGGWMDGGESSESESDEAGGSWLDEISDWFDGDESEGEPTEAEGEKSWWDELWSDDESESGESEGDEVTDEPPREIEAVSAACNTTGHGGGKSISLHGLTSSNYDHAAPIPAPFPSSVTVTERKVKVSKDKEEAVFDANGTFDVTFASNPSISLPTVPSGLTPCQEKAVQAFIDGPLTAHENDHKAAFENGYDGSFTATVSANNIKDTPEMRKRAMENPVMTEDQKRATTANAASKALDPWTQTVPGLDCKEPEKKPDASP